jgi:hypothetical protein
MTHLHYIYAAGMAVTFLFTLLKWRQMRTRPTIVTRGADVVTSPMPFAQAKAVCLALSVYDIDPNGDIYGIKVLKHIKL